MPSTKEYQKDLCLFPTNPNLTAVYDLNTHLKWFSFKKSQTFAIEFNAIATFDLFDVGNGNCSVNLLHFALSGRIANTFMLPRVQCGGEHRETAFRQLLNSPVGSSPKR